MADRKPAAAGTRRRAPSKGISEQEVKEVEELSTPRTPVIYEIVRRHGEEEMQRPSFSLWWSGLAAGLAISFSVFAQAILQLHLPDEPWRPLVSSFGYCFGFLIVVLGRQQLFTESTITAVLPVAANLGMASLVRLGRLWGIVLVANMAGCFLAALFCAFTPVVAPDILEQMLVLSRHIMELSWSDKFFRGISAGFLIAAMVWIRPAAEGAQFHVITVMTYLIAVSGSAHIVAGAVEAFLLVVGGEISLPSMIAQFFIPVLAGNVIGGTALFAMLAYAQVAKEM